MSLFHGILTSLLQKIPSSRESRISAFFWDYVRIFLQTIRGFQGDNCSIMASALTLYSLLSVVPVMALGFGIAKGFGFEKVLERELIKNIPGQEDGLLFIIDFARKLLENTKGGLIAGIGVAFLLWTVVKVLGNIESSFNRIWKIQHGRSLSRKFSDYLSMTLIAPVLVLISSSLSVFITTQLTSIAEKTNVFTVVSPLLYSSFRLIPYALIWILLSFIYIFMPNIKVHFVSGALAGIVAGTLYQWVQGGYIYFQLQISNYNAIYGSFAALPFFILWMQISWLIVLFGTELSFFHQNRRDRQDEPRFHELSASLQKIVALRTSHLLVMNLKKEQAPLSVPQIAQELDLSEQNTQYTLSQLVRSGILAQTLISGTDDEFAYLPAKSLDTLSVKYVIDALEQQGIRHISITESDDYAPFLKILKAFDDEERKSEHNLLLSEIEISKPETTQAEESENRAVRQFNTV